MENYNYEEAPKRPKGWECPACHRVYAPHVSSCSCQANKVAENPREGDDTRQLILED